MSAAYRQGPDSPERRAEALRMIPVPDAGILRGHPFTVRQKVDWANAPAFYVIVRARKTQPT